MRIRTYFYLTIFCCLLVATAFLSPDTYEQRYTDAIAELEDAFKESVRVAGSADLSTTTGREAVRKSITYSRKKLKAADIWLRYLDPVQYLKLNGQLRVEWETEVFEKFEKPYRREGTGLSLAYLYLENGGKEQDSLLMLLRGGLEAVRSYRADSNMIQLKDADHFFYANRLFLLNIATIYTTGFECPEDATVIPELRRMMADVDGIYERFTQSHPNTPITPGYMEAFRGARRYVDGQPDDYRLFDHFAFLRDHVNPLFSLNGDMMRRYRTRSGRFNDFTLVDSTRSIFSKDLYRGQHIKGVFSLVDDPDALARVQHLGRLLFYDPILSGNGKRSCASCHVQKMYFTDTTVQTAKQFDPSQRLTRATPSLLDVPYHHLIMQDGKHLTLQEQAKAVIANPIEMNGGTDVLERIMSCQEYRSALQDLLKLTPEEEKVSMDHVVSAITYYYGGFSGYSSTFDDMISGRSGSDPSVQHGFNLFMGKAKCGTCHFPPQFGGVKPPYVSSEFEVVGVPTDTFYRALSPDSGRYLVHPVPEMFKAFRTPSLRNVTHTAPYMHNGMFPTLSSVIDFYDGGGGQGHGLDLLGQTLDADSLHLTRQEKADLTAFLNALGENIPFEAPPVRLPKSRHAAWNDRKVGGEY